MNKVRLLLLSIFLYPLLGMISSPEPEEQDAVVPVSASVDPLRVDTTLFFVVDRPASFPGGIDSMKHFIEHNISIPAIYRDISVQGRPVVGFTVEKDGRLTDLALMRSVDAKLDSCAMDVIRRMPLWEPAMHQGDTVRMRFVMPVNISW